MTPTSGCKLSSKRGSARGLAVSDFVRCQKSSLELMLGRPLAAFALRMEQESPENSAPDQIGAKKEPVLLIHLAHATQTPQACGAEGCRRFGWCWRPSRRKLLEITLKVLLKGRHCVIDGLRQIRHQHHLLTHPRTSHSMKGVMQAHQAQ
ncbi:hypothetical protein MHYP_G00200050 [Metynnis hypsauchen]